MKATLLRFGKRPTEVATSCVRARVENAENGLAVSLRLPDTEEVVAVVDHADGVPALKPADRVLATPVDDGWVVTARLRKPDDAPAAYLRDTDGRLTAEAERGLELYCGPWSVSMEAVGGLTVKGYGQSLVFRPNGQVVINSQDTAVVAKDGVYIRGQRIECN